MDRLLNSWTASATWDELDAPRPQPGDAVTLIVRSPRELAHDRVEHATARTWRGHVTGWAVFSAHTEGKTWIRGHYAPESEEGAALLAAYALTQDTR